MKNYNELIPNDVIAAIYEGISDDQPWQRALAILREVFRTDWSTLRLITQSGATLKEAAIGPPEYLSEDIEGFLKHQAAQFLPTHLGLNQVIVSRWEPRELKGMSLYYQQTFEMDTSLSICIEEHETTKCILQFTRSTKLSEQHGPFTDTDVEVAKIVGMHFGRAIAFRRKMVNATVTSEYLSTALDNLGIGGLLVTPSGSVHILNRMAEKLLANANGLKISSNRLRATDRIDDAALQSALSAALSVDNELQDQHGLTLTREGNRHAIGVVIKSQPYRRLIASESEKCALVFVRTPESLTLSDTKLIQQMFGFTPAEARLAICLAQGQPLEEIECAINIRHNTARSHLRSMYQKTDVNSMAELIHLLATRTVPIGLFDSNFGKDTSTHRL